MFVFCCFSRPFFSHKVCSTGLFTGQSPGNAISIPEAPDVQEELGQIQASAVQGRAGRRLMGGGWAGASDRSYVWFGFTATDAKKIICVNWTRMLRSTVGRVPVPYESSKITMQKMNQRMDHAASLHPLPSRSKQYFVDQYRLATTIASNQFPSAIAWVPSSDWVLNSTSTPFRSRGRAPKNMGSAPRVYFGQRNWL